MNREEFASLLYQTHPKFRGDLESPQNSPSIGRGSLSIPHISSSPLSPRQIFQSRIRTLSDDNVTLQRSPDLSQRHSCELEHVSSLRVQRPSLSPLQTKNVPAYRYSDSIVRSLRRVIEEPEFVVEEREAWSTQLPKQPESRDSDEEEEAYLLEDSSQESPQNIRQDLNVFGALQETVDTDSRPKTSRGPSSESLDLSLQLARASSSEMRRSRFTEGSMNDRSVAVASSWMAPQIDEESVRPSMESRISGLSDIAEFKPAPPPATTLRQRIFRKANQRNTNEEADTTTPNPERKKKGLRKTMSTWNFHTLGGKMKIFGSAPIEQSVKAPDPVKEQLAVLDDRKRKAEEAYAQQFGLKKQKSNSGLPSIEQSSRQPSMRRRSTSTLHESGSMRSRRSRRISSTGSVPVVEDLTTNDVNTEQQSRLSRTDLEKENRQLRALLREHEKQSVGVPSSRSQPAPLFPILSIPETATDMSTSSEKRIRRNIENVPPLPPMPAKFILGGSNNVNRKHTPADTMKLSKGLPRPVSMILEVDENDENAQPEEAHGKRAMIGKQKSFEWPDDVF